MGLVTDVRSGSAVYKKIAYVAAAVLTATASLLTVPASASAEVLTTPTAKTGVISQPIAVTDLQVNGTGNDTISLNLYVTSGNLAMSTVTGLTFVGPNSGTTVQFSGARNDVNAALATLEYINGTSGNYTIEARLGGGDNDVYNPANGHVYQVVPAGGSDITWDDAKTAAESKTYGGVDGYLATITSQQEHDFVRSRVSGDGWIGATDSAVEGTWRWVTGPEGSADSGAGTHFWTGTSSGSGVPGQFANWATNEPNNSPPDGEDCAQLRMSVGGKWNDLPCTTELPFYIVEYGSDGALPTVGQTSFDVRVKSAASKRLVTDGPLTIVSTASDGTVGDGNSNLDYVTSSQDGRYVAFSSDAKNLVPNDTNNATDIFVKDTQTGAITRVSTNAAGVEANAISRRSAISADGKFVVFGSYATNLVPSDTNWQDDLFIKNLSDGSIKRVNTNNSGQQSAGKVINESSTLGISDDGRYVTFASSADNLVAGDSNNSPDTFYKDTITNSIVRTSVKTTGQQLVGGNAAYPAMSGDGAYTFFSHPVRGIVPEDNDGYADLFRRKMSDNSLAILTLDPLTNKPVTSPITSRMYPSTDGRYVSFYGRGNFVPNNQEAASAANAYWRDMNTGVSMLASSDENGVVANGTISLTGGMTHNGRYVGFVTDATNLGQDMNATNDFYIKDIVNGDIILASTTSNGSAANAAINYGSMSGDGTKAYISTYARNMITPYLTNMSQGQIYMRSTGVTDYGVPGDFIPENTAAPSLPSEPEEENAPNDGNGNNDGEKDNNQDNVASFVNPVTGKYVTLELAADCKITSVRSGAESTTVQDKGYDYRDGLLDFKADCASSSTTVKIFYHGVDSTNGLTVRKFNPDSETYSNLTGATMQVQDIGEGKAVVASYTLADNGPLDLDPSAGKIEDPVGFASVTPAAAPAAAGSAAQSGAAGAPNTGLAHKSSVPALIAGAAGVTLLAAVAVTPLVRRKLHGVRRP